MNGQKFAIATVVGGVTLFVGGFLIYGLALASFMQANSMAGLMKDPPDWVPLIVGQIAGGALLAVAIGSWAKTGGAEAGLKIGALLGLLMSLGFDFSMYATSNIFTSLQVVAVDVVASTVLFAIGGAAVGAALGKR